MSPHVEANTIACSLVEEQSVSDTEELKYYDPDDNNKDGLGSSIQVTFNESYFLQSTNDSLASADGTTILHANHKMTWHHVKHQEIDPELLHPYLGFHPS